MVRSVFLGVDIGTSSSKGVLVDQDGKVQGTVVREHKIDRPQPGQAEMSGSVWWDEFVSITAELISNSDVPVSAVGVSGMGPCVLLTDPAGGPRRPAILYGIDSRATEQIVQLNHELGPHAIFKRSGSALSTQSVGPKLAWLAEHEPTVFANASRIFMPSSWLAFQLTGNYLLDHHSASQSTPLYDIEALEWYEPFTSHIAPQIQFPPLVWPGDIAGEVSSEAAAATGLPMGTPVIAGTIDAWSEAVSVGATNPGDLMLMYGTTMFLINTVACQVTSPELWSTVGTYPGARCLAGGMATSGAITAWLKEILGSHDFNELTEKAAKSPAGANGLLMLPYFAGERTPIFDPDARGVIAGLTLTHTEGDLFRAALEATAFGVRHNIEAIEAVSGTIAQVTAVGGGVTSRLWTQIVSDITGKPQLVRQITIGASYGAARLAAATDDSVPVEQWNPPLHTVVPNDKLAGSYTEIYQLYRSLYPATREISHALAAVQRDRSSHL